MHDTRVDPSDEAESLRRPYDVGGKEAKWLPVRAEHGSEVAFVEGEQVGAAVPLGDDDQRRVGQAEVEVRIPVQDPSGRLDVVAEERLELVGALRDLVEPASRDLARDAGVEQVVQLGKDEGREQPRRCRRSRHPEHS